MQIRYMQAMGGSKVAAASGGQVLVDSYSETNFDTDQSVDTVDGIAVGQCFTATGVSLGTSKFYVSVYGSPTGNVVSKLYAISGTFGSTAVPTGAALATSDVVDVTTFPANPTRVLKTFTFSGANQYSMVNGTKYFIVLEYNGGDGANAVAVGYDGSSPTHPGNLAVFSGGWAASSTADICFYVYST